MNNSIFSTWGLLILSVLFNVYGVFVVKARLNELGAFRLDSVKGFFSYCLLLLQSPVVVIGLILFFISPILFTIALSRMELSIAYPVQIGLNFLFLILLGLIFLGEQITVYKLAGMILIFAGIYSLNK